MPKVLMIDPIPAPLVERLRPLLPGAVEFAAVPTYSEDELAQSGADADILLVIHRKVDAHLLSLVPHVRFVQLVGAGYDNLDFAAVQAGGIVAAYNPGANAVSVAEHTVLLMLALLKRFVTAESAVRQGGWPTAELLQAGLGDLATATIGLVGLGNIGSAVAERLLPFGPRLLYTARHPIDPAGEQRLGLCYTSLDELLATSTIVSLHLPLTEATQGLIDDAALAKMRDGALLINTARGELVDESALRRALMSGKLGGAGLDVLREERPGGDPFVDLPQVIVTPHIAGSSRAALERMMQMAMSNIGRFLSGQAPHDLVPRPQAS
jgi:phosphoglycerate dehydrogenase-like enzyme